MAGGGFHGEAGRVDLLAMDETSSTDALEHRLIDHEHHRAELGARNFAVQKPGDDERAVVDHGVGGVSNFDEATHGFGATFDLNRDVLAFGPSADPSVQTPIQHGQEYIKDSATLPHPHAPSQTFQHLA